MPSDDSAIEAEIQRKGLTAPRVTPDTIEAQIAEAKYHRFPGTTLTVCCLVLRNGFTVIGEAACASPENFDEELGKRIAYGKAVQQIWPLEGYLLCEKLSARHAAPEALRETGSIEAADLVPAKLVASAPKPTIGRIVHYHQGDYDALNNYGADQRPFWSGTNGTRWHPAMIVQVWSDDCVNLAVFFGDGTIEARTSMSMLPDSVFEDGVRCTSCGWRWPPRG